MQQIPHSTYGCVQDDRLFPITKKTIGLGGVTTSGAMPDRFGVR
jgi:hypothetical protein